MTTAEPSGKRSVSVKAGWPAFSSCSNVAAQQLLRVAGRRGLCSACRRPRAGWLRGGKPTPWPHANGVTECTEGCTGSRQQATGIKELSTTNSAHLPSGRVSVTRCAPVAPRLIAKNIGPNAPRSPSCRELQWMSQATPFSSEGKERRAANSIQFSRGRNKKKRTLEMDEQTLYGNGRRDTLLVLYIMSCMSMTDILLQNIS